MLPNAPNIILIIYLVCNYSGWSLGVVIQGICTYYGRDFRTIFFLLSVLLLEDLPSPELFSRMLSTKSTQCITRPLPLCQCSCMHEHKEHAYCIVGTVDGCGYDGQLKCTICDARRPCHSVLNIQKPVFRQFPVLIRSSGT